MGGKSTSQGAVLSDKKAIGSSGFDLHSWQGLTEVLKRGKESLTDPTAYAEFRNLVLEYAQQGGDIEIKKQIDKIITTFENDSTENAVPVKEKESQKRKRKRKKRKTAQSADSSIMEETITPPVLKPKGRRQPPAFKTPPIPEPTIPKSPVDPPQTLPTEPPANVEESSSAQKPEPIPEPAPESPTPTPAASPVSSPAEKVELKSDDEYKSRIAEIKRLVNEQIGNPATLIDEYNDLGRTYMMALLAALKATGPGGKESSIETMQRLEDAFKALQEAPLHEAEREQETEARPSTPVPSLKPVLQTPEDPTPTTEPKSVLAPKPEPKPAAVSQPQEDEIIPEKTLMPDVEQKTEPKANPQPKPEPKQVVVESKTPVVKSTPSPEIVTKSKPNPITSPQVPKPQPTPAPKPLEEEKKKADKEPKHSPLSTLASIVSNNEEKRKRKPEKAIHELPPERIAVMEQTDIKEAKAKMPEKKTPTPEETGLHATDAVDSTKAVVRQSELASPQVTQALYQLLEEWSLFKRSGILGIGPSGYDHPLYKELSNLSMGEIMSGRWEGANRENLKNIKDYVHAWRHEQGVAYNIQETFEHFLRRVIQRIQQRQAEGE